MSFQSFEIDKLPPEEADSAAIRDWAHKLTPDQWKELSVFLKSASTKPDSQPGKKEPEGASAGSGARPKVPVGGSHADQAGIQFSTNKIPTLPIFNGTFNKPNEVSYTQWRYAVTSMQAQYAESLLMQGIRQSVRGRGFDALYTLGDSPTVAQVIEKFDRLFSKSLTPSEIMKDLYSAKQMESESIITWSCRLEGLMVDAIDYKAQQSSQRNDVLRTQFWNGLYKQEIKNALRHKYDSGSSFEDLITAARIIEKETPSPIVASVQQTDSSKDKLDTLIKRLEALEARDTARANVASVSQDKRDRNNFRPRGRCFLCNKLGHYKSQCWYNKKNQQQGNDRGPTKGGE